MYIKKTIHAISERHFLSQTKEFPPARKIPLTGNQPLDALFFYFSLQKASCHARSNGIPFIYISANSGARIGLAEEVKHIFRVAWVEPGCPDKVRYENDDL